MRWYTSLAAGLLATSAIASDIVAIERGTIPLHPSDVLEKHYLDVSPSHHLVRRQQQQFESTATLNEDGTIDMNAWDKDAETACQDSLKRLQIASNPSGVCICYNLPSLDTSSGVFEADLRVYRLNEPSGAFEGIAPEDVKVGLKYDGASVSPVSADEVRNDEKSTKAAASEKRQHSEAGDAKAAATRDLPLLQHYHLVGKIEKDRMGDQMTM